jgi:hypothetical protein
MVTKKQQAQRVPEKQQAARREFVKKAAYVAPAIVTLAVAPSYAKHGSEKPKGPKDPKEPDD